MLMRRFWGLLSEMGWEESVLLAFITMWGKVLHLLHSLGVCAV